ncbi:MAG: hypothetical protein HPY64_11715 [Anaerolineae bacterium]|nr:hypothetical protein [Anaerolineae bacterium]
MTDGYERESGVRAWLTAWGMRLLAGLTLLVFSELVWLSHDLLAVEAGTWATLAALYLLLGALVVDLLARFRVGELFGWLAVAGLYGLLQGALVTATAFQSLPFSLVTRPLGLHTLGSGMLGLAFVYWQLRGGWTARRAVLLAAGGLAWGVWVRWSPLLPAGSFPVPAFPLAAAVAGGGLAVLGGLARLVRRLDVQPADYCLHPWEWLLVAAGLLAAFWRAAGLAEIGIAEAAILGGLAGYLLVLLFLLRGEARVPFLERALPKQGGGGQVLVLAVVIWLAAGWLGYALPGAGPDGLPLRALTTGLTLFGILWLPALSVALGLRIFTRLFREGG